MHQPGILEAPPAHARYVFFRVTPGADVRDALTALAAEADGQRLVVGIGEPTTKALDTTIEGLRPFPSLVGPGFTVPSTQTALWCWFRGDDPGVLLHASRAIEKLVAPAFEVEEVVEAFLHGDSRDLTGYEDGTENPTGDKALAAGFTKDGASFVAVQRWIHDFDRFEAKSQVERDHTIGRRLEDNEEIDDAPASAHVKRTAQEDFEPEAFVVRRSMPWSNEREAGLVFVSFGHSLDAFEAQLRRMVGLDDGISDALFTFTRPVTGSSFWCPPIAEGRIDLRKLGL